MKNLSFLQQLIQRFKSESPRFFRTLQIVFGLISAGLWLFNSMVSHHLVNLPQVQLWINWLNSIAGGTTGVVIASLLTTTDAKLIDDKTKDNVVKDATGIEVNDNS